MSTDTLFKTEGILLKNNLRDVPNKNLGLTNILTEAFGDYKYEDISIINDIATYGEEGSNNTLNFLGVREYERLRDIEIEDLSKPAINGVYTKANPFQTIKNQLDKISIQLGDSFETGGGDGLLVEYYKWKDVYGTADDIRSTGGGTFVSSQENYFTPNTAVAPSDSEAFYEFDQDDLSGKPVFTSEILWGAGIFNYENKGAFHPTIQDIQINNAGIAKFSGYFNPGNFDHGDGGSTRIGGQFTTDRLLITTESARYGSSSIGNIARSTIPVIIKFWDVDQKTGVQILGNNSPVFVGRYAPSLNSTNLKFDDDVDGDGKTDGTNPPSYYFEKAGGGGINDQYQSPADIHENSGITNLSYVKHGVYVVAPIQDGRMTKDPSERNKYLNPFKPNTFYRMEMYFILGPRVAAEIDDRNVYIEGYDRYNSRVQTLHKSHFWSENPLNTSKYKKGRVSEKIKYGISRFGTKVSGNTTRLGSIDASKDVADPARYNTPNFKGHIQSVGLVDIATGAIDVTADYKRLFSDQRLLITYKAPHSWNEIRRGEFTAPNFGPQSEAATNESFHKYHYVAWSLPKATPAGIEAASNQTGNKVLPSVGNLIIDKNSPKPRSVKGGSDGSVFDSFTYINSFDDKGGNGSYAYLSKPATGIHKRFIGNKTGLDVSIIENKGLKGYGCGRIKVLPDGRNKLEIPGLHNLDCPRTFYDGEVFGLRDIIVFEDYNDTPFIQISDTSPMGTYVTMRSSKKQSKPGIDGLPPVGSARSGLSEGTSGSAATLTGLNLANAHSDNRDLDLGKNFFVYHHRGLVDKSLDEYCILPDGQGLVVEAKGAEDTDVGATVIEVDRNDLSTYAGSRMVVPDSPRDADGNRIQFGVWGKFIDVNGTRVPNGTVINEYHNYKHFPRQLYLKDYYGGAGGLPIVFELRQRGYNCPQASDGTIDVYGSPMPGDYYYQAKDVGGTFTSSGHDNHRLVWNRTANEDKFYGAGEWVVAVGKAGADELNISGDNTNGYILSQGKPIITYPTTTSERQKLPTEAPDISHSNFNGSSTASFYKLNTNSGLSSQTNIGGHDSPNVPVGLSLHDTSSDNYAIQGLTDVVKAGFGVTICDDATKASLKYQCFKPTNTAPPFLATSTGLRTIPEGLTTLNVDNVNSVKVSYASPGAGSDADKVDAPITRVICTSFKVGGNYGNNSPGINQVPTIGFVNTTVSQHEAGTGNYFQPGGVIKNDDDILYNRLIEFENITQFGTVQRFHLMGTTDPDPTL